MPGVDDMGGRLRALRKLHNGLTQQQLADRAGVSKSLISKVEAGAKPGTWDLAVAVGAALHVDPAALMGHKPDATADTSPAEASIPALRRALTIYDYPPERHAPVRELPVLAQHVERCARLRLDANYAHLAPQLPALIEELLQAVHTLAGDDARIAYGLLANAFRCADAVAFKLHHLDLSALAIERIRWAAERTRSDLMIGTAAYVRGQNYLVTDAYESGLRALTDAGSPLASRVTTDARAAAVYGAIHMRAAVLAARGSMADAAWSHMHLATAAFDVVARDMEYLHTSVGPSVGRIYEVTVAVELGDWQAALRHAAAWDGPGLDVPSERASHYWIDLARAQMWAGDSAAAVRSLCQARARAPQHVRTNRLARDTIQSLLVRDARRSDSALGLATWAGISL